MRFSKMTTWCKDRWLISWLMIESDWIWLKEMVRVAIKNQQSPSSADVVCSNFMRCEFLTSKSPNGWATGIPGWPTGGTLRNLGNCSPELLRQHETASKKSEMAKAYEKSSELLKAKDPSDSQVCWKNSGRNFDKASVASQQKHQLG